ncbi:MAG: transcriptional regulator [Candidatus Brocadia sp.]|nr:MAG: transcriptional regulator [Candidatus Brocadia sp.]
MGKRIEYEPQLLKSLADPEQAVAYLNAALDDGDLGVFLLALQDVIKASPLGMVGTSKKSKLERTHLYRMLSEEGNPEMKSLNSVLSTLGFQFQVAPKKLHENSLS